MPEISRFFGIVIHMYFDEHPPPHIHATYAGETFVVDVNSCRVTEGSAPARIAAMVSKWVSLHKPELLENWSRLAKKLSAQKVDPLT